MFCASFIAGRVLADVFFMLVAVNVCIRVLQVYFIIGPTLLNHHFNKRGK